MFIKQKLTLPEKNQTPIEDFNANYRRWNKKTDGSQ